MADLDVSELAGLADLLETAPEQAIRAAHAAGVAGVRKIQADAQQAAPQDRPWLAKQGIRRRSWLTKNASHCDVFTVADEKGRNVGFHVEYGNSSTAPNPFLSSQMVAAAPAYEAAVIAGLDPLVKPAAEVTE